MTLQNTRKMLMKASKEGYAVPAFNMHNLETALAIVRAAAKMKSPLILAVSPSTINYAGRKYIHAIAETAAKQHNIPIALHLDHHETVESIEPALKLGVKSVMIDGSMKSFEENIAITKQVVELAKTYDATVEAELGRIAGQEDNISVSEEDSVYTDPEAAVEFIQRTNIDSLAVAIGTGHGVYETEPNLDFNRLSDIRQRVDIPLVLHGASGISEADLQECIERGIAKVNISTEFKIPFTKTLRIFLEEHPEETDLRVYMTEAMKAMEEVAIEKIRVCKSDGKA